MAAKRSAPKATKAGLGKPPTSRSKAARKRPAAPPPAEALELQLATLVDRPPAGTDWVHEIKLDGYRIAARIEHGEIQLITRRGNEWTTRAPSVVRALEKLPLENAILDGEIVSLRQDGVSDFQALQNALSDGRSQSLVYFAFDLLFLNGVDLRTRPLLERKAALAELLQRAPADDHLRLSEHVLGEGARVFEQACRLGLEGTIAKRAHAPYHEGRSKVWLKIKRTARQEFVIGGYTPPAGSRQHLGALLVGLREGEALRYAGKVGTGFDARSLAELRARLAPLEQTAPPFTPTPKGPALRDARWVKPLLVAEISFAEFTSDGRLRHASFQGLREDKAPRDVKREVKLPVQKASSRARQR